MTQEERLISKFILFVSWVKEIGAYSLFSQMYKNRAWDQQRRKQARWAAPNLFTDKWWEHNLDPLTKTLYLTSLWYVRKRVSTPRWGLCTFPLEAV